MIGNMGLQANSEAQCGCDCRGTGFYGVSCEKSETCTLTCQNNGTPVQDSQGTCLCACPEFFTGTDCATTETSVTTAPTNELTCQNSGAI